MVPKAATLTKAQANFLPLVNVHFHLRVPGRQPAACLCPTDTLTDVQVGKSYEVHYVYSTAGTDNDPSDSMNADLVADGLGGT
ncbi:unnamed protein product [Symbiodinium natans]|uniref:Uncharacterized protein n=1 Tax=Symbiodinium natans TaxID=878477 RepID=A0A812L9N6_9DINO|nr:unnamed protein product [Symbiodinium natans]